MDKNEKLEWLETDGLGGFASGTVAGIRTRRYHALLLVATRPPAGRVVLVNGFDAWVETPAGTFSLSSQRYDPDVVYPDGMRRIAEFKAAPWPQWRFVLEDGTQLVHECFVTHGTARTVLSWRLLDPGRKAALMVRPFLSGRDYHSLHHCNDLFRFDPEIRQGKVVWVPYPDLPRVAVLFNGRYAHQPDWYRNFFYEEERERGLDFVEELASPGVFHWDLSQGEALWIVGIEGAESGLGTEDILQADRFAELRSRERERRLGFPSVLERSAAAYFVRRGKGKTIVAGYPWFTDWGRDTFISLRGLCLGAGRFDEAADILTQWATAVSEGMLPNRFPDDGGDAEYNSVDASLWYIIAVHDFLAGVTAQGREFPAARRKVLQEAIEAILGGYARGTRFGIRLDHDGLLAAGEEGVQLTWMDAKVGDWVVTPRIGKPVEIQALWLNALWIAADFSEAWRELFARGREAFQTKFWNEEPSGLYDVVDHNHQPGTVDPSFRPNQIFAVGGLPLVLLEGARARRVVDAVEKRLWTRLGLRSLAPEEPGYTPRYGGGVRERDSAYHQGTVWPWLLGPFVEAWLRVRGGTAAAKQEARQRFFEPLLQHLNEAGLGHVSEIADGDPPHTARGCPFQAWSVGEALRIERLLDHPAVEKTHWSTDREPRGATGAAEESDHARLTARGRAID